MMTKVFNKYMIKHTKFFLIQNILVKYGDNISEGACYAKANTVSLMLSIGIKIHHYISKGILTGPFHFEERLLMGRFILN